MKLFGFFRKDKGETPFKREKRVEKEQQPQETSSVQIKIEYQDRQPQENISFNEKEYKKALQLYDEAQRDKAYQKKLTQFFELLTQIQEAYSVINNVGSFSDDAGNALIERCAKAIELESEIREKRNYYENYVFDMSTPCKLLAMVFEKRCEYQRAATICVYAIENGYTNDGTKGGMRGRLARMIKKGNLPLTDNIKNILNL